MAMKIRGGKMVPIQATRNIQPFIDHSNKVAYNLEAMSLFAAENGMPVSVHDGLAAAERSLVKAVIAAKAFAR